MPLNLLLQSSLLFLVLAVFTGLATADLGEKELLVELGLDLVFVNALLLFSDF